MEIMNSLSEQKQNELLSFISTNYHNQMTARELMAEVLNAGFSDAEILFILHNCDKNETFKFKPETQPSKSPTIKEINERPVVIDMEQALKKFRESYQIAKRMEKFGANTAGTKHLGESNVWRSIYIQAGGNYATLTKTINRVDDHVAKMKTSIEQ